MEQPDNTSVERIYVCIGGIFRKELQMKFAKHFLILMLLGIGIGCYGQAIDKIRPPAKDFDASELYKEPAILRAIRSNNLAKVKELVEIAKIDINARYSDPDRSIPGAQYKMDPNRNNLYDYTALIQAARLNNLDIAKYLVGKGADVNAVAYMLGGSVKKSALDYAKQNNNADMIKLLEGAKVVPAITQEGSETIIKPKKTQLEDIEEKTSKIEEELKVLARKEEIKKEIADMLAEVKQIWASRPLKDMPEGPAADAWAAEGRRIRDLIKRLENLSKLVQ